MSSLQKTGQWWVLAVGDSFDEFGIEGRDLCRSKLLRQVHDAGITLDENVWVYDKDECAQLVLMVCPDKADGEVNMEKLKRTGLTLKLAKEFE